MDTEVGGSSKIFRVSFLALTPVLDNELYLYKHGTRSKTAAGVHFM